MANKFIPVLQNYTKRHFSKHLKPITQLPVPTEPNANSDSSLPAIPKNQHVKVISISGSYLPNITRNLPTIDLTTVKNPVDFPMMVASFFNKRMQDVFKELLLIEPTKLPGEHGRTPFNTAAEFSDKGMTISVELKGFKEEDLNIRIEGPWLVIEGQSSVSVPEKEGGGLHVRHIIRRYEVPPNSDVSRIKTSFKREVLTVTIPALLPKITKE